MGERSSHTARDRKIDNELESRGLLDRQVGGLCASRDPIDHLTDGTLL
jgi:hypothetical protein